MENVIDGGCTNSNLILKVKRKNTIRFHAGSELSSSVNRMNVDVFEDRDERFETLEVKINLTSEKCNQEPIKL
jgi:hypothetical protein